MKEIRQILTLHRIAEACGLPAERTLLRDLFHEDLSIVLSAIRTLQSLKIPIPYKIAANLYSRSAWEVQRRLLEYFRSIPQIEYADFLMAAYPGALSEQSRAQILMTLGAQPDLSDEQLEFLRQKTHYQNPSQEQREGALKGLGLAGEHLHLAEFAHSNFEVEGEQSLVEIAVSRIREKQDAEVFQRLHKLYRNIAKQDEMALFTLLGRETIRALFETYEDNVNIQPLFVQLKDKIAGFCRSEDPKIILWVVQTLQELEVRDAAFFVRSITSLLLTRTSGAELQQTKADLFWKIHVNLRDSLHFKNMASIFEKLFYGILQDLNERKKLMEMKHSREPKADVVEFFESLQHPNLLSTVINYLKSTPPDENLKGLIISILRKMQGSLNPRQLQLLPSVTRQLLMEDGRQRAAVAVECGKIDLEKSPARIFRHLKFLMPVAAPFLSDKTYRQFQQLYRILSSFEEGKGIRTTLLKSVLAMEDKESFSFVWKSAIELDEDSCNEVLGAIQRVEFSWLAFLKPEFSAKKAMPERKISQLLRLLETAGRVEDVEWQRILLQMHKGDFGRISEDLSHQILMMLAKSGNPGSLDVFAHLVKAKGFLLGQNDVDVLFKYTVAIRETDFVEYREQLKDVVYGCLKSENEFYYTDLGYILYLLGEKHGVDILRKSFDSKNPQVLLKTVDYAAKCELCDVWRVILGYTEVSDFRLHNQIVAWFSRMKHKLSKADVLEYLEKIRDGESVGVDSLFEDVNLHAEETQKLRGVLDDLRTMRSGHKTRFELEQNIQELTIFFIDIAGYTKKSATSDIGEVMLMLDEFAKIIVPIGKKYRGNLIKKIGDCYMYTFESPIEAVMASLEVQSELRSYNEFRVDKDKLNTRIGLNTGKVFTQDNDVYGDPVNVASRVESKAPLNNLLINETTYLPIQDFVVTEKQEPVAVKGVDKPLQTYVVRGLKKGVQEAYFESLNP